MSSQEKRILTPREHLGFEVGEERMLADWPQVAGYFHHLDDASGRVQTREIGKTTEGNPFLVATISSPENLADLERYRAIQERLADPRTVASDQEAQRLIANGKAVVAITCSIHATEVGATQMSMLLGHHLASSDDDDVKRVLDSVILLLVPCLNPDGLILVKRWYDGSVGTHYEGTIPPFLYHRYCGHDNNRDWFMFTQAETKLVVEHVLNAWHPQILYDLHQTRSSGMRMILPPFVDPVGPNVDPIIQSELAMLGSAIAAELTAQGKPGVAMNMVYDAYSPSRTYQHYHAGVRLLSEVASARIASPVEIHPSQLRSDRGETPTQKCWNHPLPWKGGHWSLRDIVDYDLAAALACLNNAARYRDMWLRNFYAVGENAVAYAGNPHAFVIPERQRDPNTAAELLEVMQTAMVEIHEAVEPFQADGHFYPAGTRVILADQPYWAFAKTMMEAQRYPDLRTHPGGPPRAPYDVTAHCLPLQMGVNAIEIKASFAADLKPLENVRPPGGKVVRRETGQLDPPSIPPLPRGDTGGYRLARGDTRGCYLLHPGTNASARAVNRLLAEGAEVLRAREPLNIDRHYYPQGTFIVKGGGADGLIEATASEESLTFDAFSAIPPAALYQLHKPRIGLYRSYVPNTEEGWTRFVFEEYGFDYTSLHDPEIRRGGLEGEFDAIVLPHQYIRHIHRGHHSTHYHQDYCGGLGDEGAERLRQFVERGGTLIAWDGAARYAIQHLDLPVRNALAGLTHDDFFAPGSLVSVLLDTNHPIAYGMPDQAAAMFFNSPAFEVGEGRVVGKYPRHNPLLSGWLIGPEKLFGKAAIASVPLGGGEVVLIGFRVHFRAQVRGTYRILFNSLYYSTARRDL